MKVPLLAVVFGCAAQLTTGCKHDADVRPVAFDTLAQATGYWEWESTGYQSGQRTPASVGFTRQVVFGNGNNLTVSRNNQLYYQTNYQFSTGTGAYCGGPSAALVTFVSEPDLGNNDIKIYYITQQNGHQVLSLVGEAACVDGGAFETYHWVAE